MILAGIDPVGGSSARYTYLFLISKNTREA